MIVHVHGGLCNRLRAILSYRNVCGPITVAWRPDGQVAHERFSDAFGHLAGVEFIDNVPSGVVSTYEPHPDAPAGWEKDYLQLRPVVMPPVIPGKYAAVHMRRTDAVAYQTACGAYENDAAFEVWCAARPESKIFIATDNGTTQQHMQDAVLGMLKQPQFHSYMASHKQENQAEVRNTSLLHAVWDIYTCARAEAFKGSGASSFTHLINLLRSMR